jgi:L-seryl-tRNA(Ser) seleniumtransferase
MTSMDPRQRDLRLIPKVDDLLHDPRTAAWLQATPRWLVTDAVRDELDAVRRELLAGSGAPAPPDLLDRDRILDRVERRLAAASRFKLRRVINATGIIIHTNLGRAVLAPEAVARLEEAARGYTNLEFDLEAGRRGSRHEPLRDLLRRLTGAEDALVVNNNAAAVLLCLNTLARGREVIVSRGELVEIGGSFRIPEVMARSGAILREVGATNRTHPRDYEAAAGEQTALLLKVHTSNYRMVGFIHETGLEELVALGRARGIPVMEDLGSGCLVDLAPFGLADERPVPRSVAAGADLVTFSGDKLLGGPQAGIIVGRRDLIRLLDANPLHRALRIDKFTVAALEATLRLYLEGEDAFRRIPVLAAIAARQEDLLRAGRRRLARWRPTLPSHLTVTVERTASQVGGGALPMQDIPSAAFAVTSSLLTPNEVEAAFRAFEPPIIGRIEEGRLLLDLRTLLPDDFPAIGEALQSLAP